jgi:hypothetical protein
MLTDRYYLRLNTKLYSLVKPPAEWSFTRRSHKLKHELRGNWRYTCCNATQ